MDNLYPDRTPFKPDFEPELQPQVREVSRNQGMSWLDFSGYHKMSDFLGLNDAERRAPKIAEQVSYLTDWAQEVTGKKDEASQMRAINQLKRDLGTTYKGLDLITILYRYARLDEQKRSVEGEMSAYQNKRKTQRQVVKRKSISKPTVNLQSNIDKKLKSVSGVIEKKVNETISAQIGKTLDNVMRQFGR